MRPATATRRGTAGGAEGARRFETWEYSYVNVLGLGAAVRQVLDLGPRAAGERAVALGRSLRDRLRELPGVSVHDLGVDKCAIVTAAVAGHDSADVAEALGRRGINVSVTVPKDNPLDTEDRGVHPLVRLSPHYYNTDAEIDRAVDAISDIVSGRTW